MQWMINTQLGRRNLTPEQKSYLRGKRYEQEKKSHGGDRRSEESRADNQPLKPADERQGERTDLTSGENHQKSDTTAAQLAGEYGVGERTDLTSPDVQEKLTTAERLMALGREGRAYCYRLLPIGV